MPSMVQATTAVTMQFTFIREDNKLWHTNNIAEL